MPGFGALTTSWAGWGGSWEPESVHELRSTGVCVEAVTTGAGQDCGAALPGGFCRASRAPLSLRERGEQANRPGWGRGEAGAGEPRVR